MEFCQSEKVGTLTCHSLIFGIFAATGLVKFARVRFSS